MKVLVTGGAGFIGSNIVDAMLQHGHQVAVLDNLSTGKKENLDVGTVFHPCDVGDAVAVHDVMEEERPEVVFHLAAEIDVRKSIADICSDAATNVLGTIGVLEATLDNGVRRLVFSSTGGALYGEPECLPVDESAPILPLSPYGVAKYCAEQYISYFHRARGLETVVLRYSNVYGPRQDPLGEAGVVAIFTKKILSGERPVIYGDGRQTRDFVFVGDVVQANLLAMNGPQGTFNIGTGVETSVNDLVHALEHVVGRRIEPEYRPARVGEVQRVALRADKAESGLGWKAAVSLEEGLEQTLEWYKRAF
jgi:UDP-glucose 4-epimerase